MKIAAVSYLNTIPFIYGLRRSGLMDGIDLLLAPPAECTKNFMEGRADVALVPVAAVPTLKDAQVVTGYCIGAEGAVRTVVVVSNTPIEKVKKIYLDPHSQTSVRLTQYLAKNRWKIQPEYAPVENYDQTLAEGEAMLLIGDKVFDYEGRFTYAVDLAGEWIAQTKLPFAFAVWVARKGTPEETLYALEEALTFGVEHTYEAILEAGFDKKPYDAYTYLTRHIDYLLDGRKRRAMELFLETKTTTP